MKPFHVATDEEIKAGRTTDVYFVRTRRILEAKGKDGVRVVAEVTTGGLPDGRPWGVLCGMEEVAGLFEGVPVDVYGMPEGSVFRPRDINGVRLPVMYVEGTYHAFCELETPLLGFICQESGVATRAAYVKKVAGEKNVVAFGARRAHPALAPALDRAAYIGGLDGVSTLRGAEAIDEEPMGTMPHALMIVFEDQVEAWRAYDQVMPPDVPRVVLVDTYYDEKVEAVRAAEAIKERLSAVRLDTPGSRRGDFPEIIREVRWELDLRGFNDVGIFVSGGLDEEAVGLLGEAGADGFGVGTYVSCAPAVDFALDIVEVEGRPAAKRGKLSGRKQVWRCHRCMVDVVQPSERAPPKCPTCNGEMKAVLQPLIKDGEIVGDLKPPREIREFALDQIRKIERP
ncbi:MAG: nicotinate phosphoribosyltransferase [Candidatus Bathyarchaeota archaeon]|nr:nicotinate phosphoribosyltransferase [Candidatus Bathyarchaeota archaeon]